jgi:8-oxo-dGTP diphosphatase
MLNTEFSSARGSLRICLVRQDRVMSDPIRVVAAIIVRRDGSVLACRRASGRVSAGRWEFPGGKVEVGETPKQALERELLEELGLLVRAGPWFDRTTTSTGSMSIDLDCYVVSIDDDGPVRSTDHDQLRWCGREDLSELDWAEPDLPAVRKLMAGHSPVTGRSG